MSGVDGVRVGAVVLVTLRVGEPRWDKELCDVLDTRQLRTGLVAACRSCWSPTQVHWVPVNDLSVELVAPPVEEVQS